MQENIVRTSILMCCITILSLSSAAQCDNPPVLVASDDFTHHCVGETLECIVANAPVASCSEDAGEYTYCPGNNEDIIFNYCTDDAAPGTSITINFTAGTIEEGFDHILVYDGPNATGTLLVDFQGDIAGMSFASTNASGCLSFQFTSDASISCATGEEVEIAYEVSCAVTPNFYTVEWAPALNVADPSALNTEIVGLTQDQEFVVTVFETANPDCSTSESVFVTFESNYHFGENSEGALCSSQGMVNLTDQLDGNPDDVGTWTNPNGNQVASDVNANTLIPGLYTYSYAFCEENSADLNLIIAQAPELEMIDDFGVSCSGESLGVTIYGEGSDASCSINAGDYDYCYGNDQDLFFLYCPDEPGNGNPMRIDFTGGFLEVNFDRITVFDGNDINDPVLDVFDGLPAGRTYVATNPDGCISFRLESDYSINCQEGSFSQGPITWTVYCADELFTYDVSWSPSNYLDNPSSATPEIHGLDADTEFTVTVSSAIAPACVAQGSVFVTFLDSINLGFDTTLDLCADADPVNLFDLMAGNPIDTGIWTDAEGNPVSIEFDPQIDVDAQYFYSHPDCQNSTLVDVTVRPLPNVNAGNNVGLCPGTSTTLQASGANSYSWAGLGSGNTVTVSPAQTTTYTVTGFSIYGCSADDSVVVSVLTSDQVEIVEEDGILSVDQGSQFQWYLNGLPILGATQQSFDYQYSGTYTVLINASSDCSVTTEPYEIIVGVYEFAQGSVNIYPQPAQSWIQIDSEKAVLNLSLYSTDGRLVLNQSPNLGNFKLDLSTLETGIYILKLELRGGHLMSKSIVIQ